MSVNMFEVEGWRLKLKDKNLSLPKTSSHLRSVWAKAGAILKPPTTFRYAFCSMRYFKVLTPRVESKIIGLWPKVKRTLSVAVLKSR